MSFCGKLVKQQIPIQKLIICETFFSAMSCFVNKRFFKFEFKNRIVVFMI